MNFENEDYIDGIGEQDGITMKKRIATMTNDKDENYLCMEKEKGGSLIFKDSDRLLVFLFSFLLFSICVKCVVMGDADMNYLKVICEIKVMPV